MSDAPPAMQPTRANRSARTWGLRLRWFGAEFLVVVSGVLVAIALNAWYQGRRDAATEATYLALLSRDVEHTMADLREAAAFERSQELNGLTAYRALSSRRAGPEPDSVRVALTELLIRRTATLSKATYEDLLSTGNLGLIGNRGLRDRIVRFYDEATTLTDILNRNNAAFVDGLYNRTLVASGLILPKVLPNPVGGRGLRLADSLLLAGLRGGYDDEPDPLWSPPRKDPAWAPGTLRPPDAHDHGVGVAPVRRVHARAGPRPETCAGCGASAPRSPGSGLGRPARWRPRRDRQPVNRGSHAGTAGELPSLSG